MAMSTGGAIPSVLALALLNLTVQRVAVLVPELGRLGLPGPRGCPLLDGLLLLLGVALLGRGDQRGVDDLAAHSDVASLAQRRVEPVEQIRSVQVGRRVGLRIFLIQGTER
jgi:hypothetical protein